MEEREVLKEILKQALVCKTRLEEIVDFALAYSGKDVSVIFEKLATALKVSEGASCYSVELFSLKNAPLPLIPHCFCHLLLIRQNCLMGMNSQIGRSWNAF